MASNNSGESQQHVVVGHSGCGWTVKQLDEYKKNNVKHETVMCDKTPEHPLCAMVKAYPSHAECTSLSDAQGCKVVSEGFKMAN